ncbi:MAG: hypothetical protein NZ898_00675 [Myxococcota bacterium]|nr:hypothetical protein [Myxococcota bacterium]
MRELRGGSRWMRRPTDAPRYLVHARLFALAMVIHLTLPENLAIDRLGATALGMLGALALAIDGWPVGWPLVLASKLWALAIGDVLTQSFYLTAVAAAATACTLGSASGLAWRTDRPLALLVRVPTVALYALAALHKLNRGFFDVQRGCAAEGLRILAENWSLPWLATLADAPLLPHAFLLAEIGVSVLLVLWPAAGIALAALMHIPLTVVFAPAFAAPMVSGWVAFLGTRDLVWLRRLWRRRWPFFVGFGVGAGSFTFALYLRDHHILYPFWHLKEAALWMLSAWALTALATRPRSVLRRWGAWREPVGSRGLFAAVALALLCVAHGLTPYLGLRFHGTGAMLSNLRIDEGCWNSLVFPESMRLVDPYVRFDEVRVGGRFDGAERTRRWLLDGLHDRRVLAAHVRHVCARGAGPIAVRGRWRGEPFRLDDLCDVERWPFAARWLPRARPFQSGLPRQCAQRCMHRARRRRRPFARDASHRGAAPIRPRTRARAPALARTPSRARARTRNVGPHHQAIRWAPPDADPETPPVALLRRDRRERRSACDPVCAARTRPRRATCRMPAGRAASGPRSRVSCQGASPCTAAWAERMSRPRCSRSQRRARS